MSNDKTNVHELWQNANDELGVIEELKKLVHLEYQHLSEYERLDQNNFKSLVLQIQMIDSSCIKFKEFLDQVKKGEYDNKLEEAYKTYSQIGFIKKLVKRVETILQDELKTEHSKEALIKKFKKLTHKHEKEMESMEEDIKKLKEKGFFDQSVFDSYRWN